MAFGLLGIRMTFWAGLALWGYYFLAAELARRALRVDSQPLFLVFLILLFLYGLWTRAPRIALLLSGAIAFLWLVGGLGAPGAVPEVDPARPAHTLYHVAGPVLAVGFGVLTRAWMRRRPTGTPEAT
jgi:hypothetical protein